MRAVDKGSGLERVWPVHGGHVGLGGHVGQSHRGVLLARAAVALKMKVFRLGFPSPLPHQLGIQDGDCPSSEVGRAGAEEEEVQHFASHQNAVEHGCQRDQLHPVLVVQKVLPNDRPKGWQLKDGHFRFDKFTKSSLTCVIVKAETMATTVAVTFRSLRWNVPTSENLLARMPLG